MSAVPKAIRLQDKGRRLQLDYAGRESVQLSAEYLRVFSPSAEVQGHGLSEPQLVGGKQDVRIEKIEAVGRYAVRLLFSDGHNSGLYSWDGLQTLSLAQDDNWARYLERLREQGMSRREEDNIMPLGALRPRNALKPD